MGTMASQITSLTIVYSTVYSGADQRKHQSSASLAFVRGIHRGPVNSPHKWPVKRKMFQFDDVIMKKLTSRHNQNQFWFVGTNFSEIRPIIGSDNDMPPNLRQTNIWTNAGLLLIEPLGKFSATF